MCYIQTQNISDNADNGSICWAKLFINTNVLKLLMPVSYADSVLALTAWFQNDWTVSRNSVSSIIFPLELGMVEDENLHMVLPYETSEMIICSSYLLPNL